MPATAMAPRLDSTRLYSEKHDCQKMLVAQCKTSTGAHTGMGVATRGCVTVDISAMAAEGRLV